MASVLSVMEVILALKATPLFASIHGEGLKRISDAVREVHVPAGQLVFAENDLGEEMYMVCRGKIRLSHGPENSDETLAVLESGSYFGEMAIIDDLPRSASAHAAEDSTLLVLHKEDFRNAVYDHPDIANEIFKAFTQRLRRANARIRALSEALREERFEAL